MRIRQNRSVRADHRTFSEPRATTHDSTGSDVNESGQIGVMVNNRRAVHNAMLTYSCLRLHYGPSHDDCTCADFR